MAKKFDKDVLDMYHGNDWMDNNYRKTGLETTKSNHGWYECPKCHKHYHKSDMDVDHIVPRKYGGGNNRENLQLICKHDNRSKGADLSDVAKDYARRQRELKSMDNKSAAKKFRKDEDSGCFVTTAVCGSFGKPDNCYELETFRAFRDNWLKKQTDGAALIDEYYDVAPRIVAVIDKLNNAKAVYADVWETYLRPCLKMIEAKDYQGCKETYTAMVNALKKKYIG